MSEVSIVKDIPAAAVELFVEATAGAVAARGSAAVALTGGSTAKAFFEKVRVAPNVPWARIDVYFTDERAVPPDHPESNFGIAQRELFPYVKPRSVHRMRGESSDLDAEAQRLASELKALGKPPRFDAVMLGIGPDGHICSLFAGVPTSAERGDDVLVRHVAAPTQVTPHLERLTLTPFLIVTARTLITQVTANKAAQLKRALEGPDDLLGCPAQWLRKASGRVVMVADEQAAAML